MFAYTVRIAIKVTIPLHQLNFLEISNWKECALFTDIRNIYDKINDTLFTNVLCTQPAVDHHWSSIHWIAWWNLSDEPQQGSRMLRDPKIWPGSEMELLNYPLILESGVVKGKGANGVISEDQALLQVDPDVPIYIRPFVIVWPILVTFDLQQVIQDKQEWPVCIYIYIYLCMPNG